MVASTDRHETGMAQNAPGSRTRYLAFIDRKNPVDDDIVKAFRKQQRLFIGGGIHHLRRIEQKNIGAHARANEPAIRKAHSFRGPARHFAHGVGKRQNMTFFDIFGDDTRKIAIGSWVGIDEIA